MEWTQTYGPDSTTISDVTPNETGYAFAGTTVEDASEDRGLFISTDEVGHVELRRRHHFGEATEFKTIVSADDDSFLVGGRSGRGVLAKLEADGSRAWHRRIEAFDQIRHVAELSDGRYALADTGSSPENLWAVVAVYDAETDTVQGPWTWGESESPLNRVRALFAGPDDELFVVGSHGSSGGWLWRIDASGERTRTVDFGPHSGKFHATRTDDGGFAVAGTSGSSGWLIRLDEQGERRWEKSYPSLDSDFDVTDVVQFPDDGFGFVGDTTNLADPDGDVVVVRTEADGEERWRATYEQSATTVHTALPAADGFLLAGETNRNEDETVGWATTVAAHDERETVGTTTNPSTEGTIPGFGPVVTAFAVLLGCGYACRRRQ
ncbi:hypothetical protein NGM10_02540 [Halorussus salilacus]|uniref:hypothetical protein n=1 Tax=Halorussus salilacus TaxID=2953750 RepID=UPI00209D4EAE|nr:hypothetical protein [Halorussus salilacus]USZ68629.1 hypothetical protein NGM10_02540 [Halorussus salilacus]